MQVRLFGKAVHLRLVDILHLLLLLNPLFPFEALIFSLNDSRFARCAHISSDHFFYVARRYSRSWSSSRQVHWTTPFAADSAVKEFQGCFLMCVHALCGLDIAPSFFRLQSLAEPAPLDRLGSARHRFVVDLRGEKLRESRVCIAHWLHFNTFQVVRAFHDNKSKNQKGI